MVEVFKTNIQDHIIAQSVKNMLTYYFPFYEVNFDLLDCDNILRVKSQNKNVEADPIIRTIQKLGFEAAVLED